jgi:predicted 2-oxoglutarate/Fe(II)-dependent dioxygenase YbiX
MTTEKFTCGDPVPWFDAKTLAATEHNLGVMAGRWIVLCFVNDLSHDGATRVLADIISTLGRFFNDDHVIFYGVLTALPPAPIAEKFIQASHRGLGFIADYEYNLTNLFHARQAPQLVVIDPMLRVEKIFILAEDGVSSDEICNYLCHLPSVDDYAGVSLAAPALIIPRVFESEFCEELMALHNKNGGMDSGFMLDSGGKTKTVIDHNLKQRQDLPLEEPAIREAIRSRVVRRVVPMMERFLQYRPTRMDRYLVSCYDAETGGHFARHRDNVNVGARHRRFAASFNLNDNYVGCGLVFPEFGRRVYVAPRGGAIVFSTGALHQVLPITSGKRYAFVPFFYGEEEAGLRLQNNLHLHDGEGLYTAERDKLFPDPG